MPKRDLSETNQRACRFWCMGLTLVAGVACLRPGALPTVGQVILPMSSMSLETDPHATYRDIDDGAHPSPLPGYFEWWYYDMIFEDGSSAVVSLFAAQMLEEHGAPSILLNITEPSGDAYSSSQTLTKDRVSLRAPGEVRIGDAAATRQDKAVRLTASGRTEAGVELAVDLELSPQMPGYKPGTGEIRFDGKVVLGWAVPMPRAAVAGTIRVGSRSRVVRGFGYHDHNWGEVNLTDYLGYWYWGRIASSNLTLIYYDVHFRTELGQSPVRLLVAGDASRLARVFSEPKVVAFAPKKIEAAGRRIPQWLELSAPEGVLRLEQVQILEAQDLASFLPWWQRPAVRAVTKAAYIRTLSDYEFAGAVDGLPVSSSGTALTEFLYVRDRDVD